MSLKQVLKQARIEQKALAQAIGVSPATVAQIVNHNLWPKSLSQSELQQKIRDFLSAQQVVFDADTLFEATTTTHITITESEEVMLLRKQGLTPEAKKHFGLFRHPFEQDVCAQEDVFLTKEIREARQSMWQTAKYGGFMAVIGESGSGKSTLRRDLIDRIQQSREQIIVIEPFVLGMEDNDAKGKTLKAVHVAEAIISAVAPLEKIKASSEARFSQVNTVLKESSRAGNSHVLIIEEAHGLPIPTLKHLKRFNELEDGFKRPLSIILIGQTELALKLSESNHQVREVVQRCEVTKLPALADHLEAYLKFKFERLGKALSEVIDAGGIEEIRSRLVIRPRSKTGTQQEEVSLLYPLAINNLMTACMNMAQYTQSKLVCRDVVREVLKNG